MTSDQISPLESLTAFRATEKHFKSRAVPNKRRKLNSVSASYPSLLEHGVVDLSRPVNPEEDEVALAGWNAPDDCSGGNALQKLPISPSPGETDKIGWLVAEGVILIPGYLTPDQQLELLECSLSEYTLPPNPLSLDTHYSIPLDPPLFELYSSGDDRTIPSKAELQEPHGAEHEIVHTRRELISNPPAAELGTQHVLEKVSEWKGDEPSPKLKGKTAEGLIKEMRWANLGLVYNWTNKMYDLRTGHIQFPVALQQTCIDIVRRVPWSDVFGGAGEGGAGPGSRPDWERWDRDYAPDTGIVNFYQTRDSLMAHVDRSEFDPYRPLISLSLGHAAIFLLGSSTRDTRPLPILLRSGDVIIMSGQGRRCYHGVPRIMEGTLPRHFLPAEGDTRKRQACKRFISTARININVRQVFPADYKHGERAV